MRWFAIFLSCWMIGYSNFVMAQSSASNLNTERIFELVILNSKVAHLYQQGSYAEAEELARQSVVVSEDVYGLDDVNTAASINNLAAILSVMGRY